MDDIKVDYTNIKDGINYFTSIIIYAPLIILALYVIYLFLPVLISAINGGQNITQVLKTIMMKLTQIFYVIFRPIIFILKKIWGGIAYLFGDAWGSKNRMTTIVCMIAFVILTTSSLFFAYGTPETLGVYGQVITPIMVLLLAIAAGYVFMVFNRSMKDTTNDSNLFPKGKDFSEQSAWLFRRTNMYLYAVLCMTVILGILGLGAWYVFSHGKDGGIAATQAAMVIGTIALLYLGHMLLKKFNILGSLKNNRFLELLYHFIFLIPCLITDIINYLYKELKHTPKVAYYILGSEIAFIILWLLIPILKKKIYLNVNHDKSGSWTFEIQAIRDSISILSSDILNLKKIHPDIETWYFWTQVMRNKLYLKTKSEELKALILTYKIKDEKIIERLITTVQANTKEIFKKQQEIGNYKEEIENVNNKYKSGDSTPVSVLLQNKPVKLDKQRMIGDHEKLNKNGVLPVNNFSYDYALSCWVYLNSSPPNYHKNKNRVLINFSNKPKISYNPIKNTIEIATRIRDKTHGAIAKTFIIEKIKLQKWINLVINYDAGILDVFMDGELVYSEPGLIPFMTTDTVIIGDNNGVKGGICNVAYFASHISKTRIKTNYNYLKDNNPPVV
jgi:hypothetical protein